MPLRGRGPHWIVRTWNGWTTGNVQALFAKLLSAEATHTRPDPYGQVSAGSLQVQAPFKTGWLLPSIWYPENYTIWGED
jgi:hypothetical protein